MNIYLVFYISLLEKVLPGVLLVLETEIEPVNPNTEYKVEKILDYKYINKIVKYLIK